ncbi:hypothetical protein [Cellulomonas sp. ATA003]|uniref:hypothetical protein n=1 Tax=Cellulomonas sp. ATA003 TaxID=3073064 RepID=UPI002873490C|nr:hypothetical protein [Cellulomonas sp. ATA003]WNB87655.1 hypothetical protein REH70_17225 [Cellulomonas sp. ATA003]
MSEHRPDPTPESAPDSAFDRLLAADPAARLTPDTDVLDAAVRARLGADGPLVVSGGRDQLAAARAARRPSRWAAVAAVAAGTLVVGSAGFALGERAGDGGSVPTATVMLPGPAGATGEGTTGQGGPPVAADTRIAGPEGSASATSLPWSGGRIVFRGAGLSDEAGVAEAWAYDPAQVFGAETASVVASSLGLEEEPRLEGVTWTVGPLDGSAASLQLQPDGVASVMFYDPATDPFRCMEPVPEPAPDVAPEGGATPDAGDGAGSSGSAPAGPGCPPAATAALQGDAAVARAREVVAATGANPAAFEYEVADAGVPSAAYVTAYGIIGGQRTGNVWSMTLVGDAVQSLYGALAPLVPLGSYDVVSPSAAVARLTDPRFGGGVGGPVMAAEARTATGPAVEPDEPVADDAAALAEGPAAPAGSPPAAVQPGSPFAWPVTTVTLTGARLGLTQHVQPDGATALLPAYELTADDGSAWSVVAVAESALDLSPLGR